MATETQEPQPQKGLTFDAVWAMFQETTLLQKETTLLQKETALLQKETALMQKETDKKFRETDKKFQETDKQIQETDKQIQEISLLQKETDKKFQETAKQIQALNKQMGGLHESFGELAEQMVAPNLATKFRELHYTFTRASHDMEVKDANGRTLTEVDVWLENGDDVMAVEVKGKLLKKDVDDHLQRMAILQGHGKARGDKRKLLGAVAGGIVRKDARDYAIQSGFYVIEQSGDTLKIEMPQGFTPKAW